MELEVFSNHELAFKSKRGGMSRKSTGG